MHTHTSTLLSRPFTFRKARASDKALIHEWWHKPHVQEFWDNSPQMWQNAEHYLEQGVTHLFDYWLALDGHRPFALILTSLLDNNAPAVYQPFCDAQGLTYSIDLMIGEETYLGKGLAALTLQDFMAFCPASVTCFLIDPASQNTKAIHVYQKAGFSEVGRFTPQEGSFQGKQHILMRYKRF